MSHLFRYASDPRFSYNLSTDDEIDRLSNFLNDSVNSLLKRVDFITYCFDEVKRHESNLLNDMNDFNKSKDSNFSTDNNTKILNQLRIKYVTHIKHQMQMLEKEMNFTVNSNRYDELTPTKHWTAYHQAKKRDFISYDLYESLVRSIVNCTQKLSAKKYRQQKKKIGSIIDQLDTNMGPIQDKLKALQYGITEFINEEDIRLSNLSLSKNIKLQLIIMLINYFYHYQ
jgi:hypothetical protein